MKGKETYKSLYFLLLWVGDGEVLSHKICMSYNSLKVNKEDLKFQELDIYSLSPSIFLLIQSQITPIVRTWDMSTVTADQ